MARESLYKTELGKEIAEKYRAGGYTITQLAGMYHVSKSAVWKTVAAHGASKNVRQYKIPYDARQHIAKAYVEQGATLEDLAQQYRCSETTIHNAVVEFYGPEFEIPRKKYKARGTWTRSKSRPAARRKEEALRLFDSGMDAPEIAKTLGVNLDTVSKYLKDSGYGQHHCSVCGGPVKRNARKYCSETCASVGSRDNRLKNHFGIDLEAYSALHKEQDGKCKICGGTEELVVDHDHETGVVRGILCRWCNLGIGFLKEDVSLLEKSIEYLSGQ